MDSVSTAPSSAPRRCLVDDMDQAEFADARPKLRDRYERAAQVGRAVQRWFAAVAAAVPLSKRLSFHARYRPAPRRAPARSRCSIASYSAPHPSAVLAETQVPFAGLRVQESERLAVAVAGDTLQWEAVRTCSWRRADLGNAAASGRATRIDSRVSGQGWRWDPHAGGAGGAPPWLAASATMAHGEFSVRALFDAAGLRARRGRRHHSELPGDGGLGIRGRKCPVSAGAQQRG